MPNPRKTRPAERKQSRNEVMKPDRMWKTFQNDVNYCKSFKDDIPVLVLDWSPAGQEWLIQELRMLWICGANPCGQTYKELAESILRRMEELAKMEGPK